LAVALAFVFSAMTAAWSFGGYMRTRSTTNLLASIGFTVITLAAAWYLKKLARPR
jgi:hypothetical protein